MTETTYPVTGMTCEHCANAVTAELSKIDGVSSVAVDLSAGVLNVSSAAPVDTSAVRAAIEEAGYHLVA